MSRRDFIRLVGMGMVLVLLPLRFSAENTLDWRVEEEDSPRFDLFALEDISGEPSRRGIHRILGFPVKSVEIMAPENPPWERIVVLARV